MKANITALTHLPVYFDDLDAGNVVYHANYLKLCDRARNIALAEAGCPITKLIDLDLALAVVRCETTFRKPLKMQDIMIATRLVSWSTRSLTVRHAIYDPDIDQESVRLLDREIHKLQGCYFHSETTLVSVQVSAMTSVPLPSILRDALGIDHGKGALA